MEENNKIIGQELTLGVLRNCLVGLSRGKGSVVCVTGDSGLGKTFVLSGFADEVDENEDCNSAFVQCQPAIGNFRVSNIQPLFPFQKILEKLEEKKVKSAGKRFASDVGLITLSTIPIGGEVFYWIKEVKEAFEKFKKEKKRESTSQISIGAEFYYNAITRHAEKKSLVLLIDDLHFGDTQSIELLSFITERIATLPILLVFSVNKAILEVSPTPLNVYLDKFKSLDSFFVADLESFNLQDIRELSRLYFPNYKAHNEFEDFIFQRSYGVPGVVNEYLKFFSKNTPFNTDGELSDSFGKEGFMPTSIHAAFSDIIEKLTEEERNILAICSSEGKEFTAYVVAKLLNTDVLTAIKKLKILQNNTRIIKSLGAKTRHGQTTTVYEFTQAFYQTFFENTLEYEEKVAIHGQIKSILKQLYQEAQDEAVRENLAPYIAAHSIASGDDETAKEMLLETAKAAQEYGSTDIVRLAYDSFSEIKERSSKTEENGLTGADIAFKDLLLSTSQTGFYNGTGKQNGDGEPGSDALIDFNSLRTIIVDDFLRGEYGQAADKAVTYFNAREKYLRLAEQAQLLSIAIRSYIELKDFNSAGQYSQKALDLNGLTTDPISETFVYNACAILSFFTNKPEDALNYLSKAAQKALLLPRELRLLTLSNIALIQEKTEPEKSKRYYTAIKKLLQYLNFEELRSEIFN